MAFVFAVVLVDCVFVVVFTIYPLTNCMTFCADDSAVDDNDDFVDFLIVVIALLSVALLMTLPFSDY